MFTPENLEELKENEIFVFGSNRAGRHGKGSALVAMKKFGAKRWQGEGLQGQSYGIPTKDGGLRTLTLEQIQTHVNTFVKFASERKDLTFYVTKIGCGLAGYTAEQIGPLFKNCHSLENVILPEEFHE
jgi:hypothetical protein